ncbi:MAG: hypothetical protein HY978_00340 [Candidatus Liptonbacteria bacterium]|nr:hypothetical protein [Candidatus Liptonbacteria bacterium]
MEYLLLVGNAAASFLCCRALAGKKAGERGRLPSLRLRFRGYVIHFHHWLYAAVALIILFHQFPMLNLAYVGLPAGVLAQGLTYKDFHKVIYRMDR